MWGLKICVSKEKINSSRLSFRRLIFWWNKDVKICKLFVHFQLILFKAIKSPLVNDFSSNCVMNKSLPFSNDFLYSNWFTITFLLGEFNSILINKRSSSFRTYYNIICIQYFTKFSPYILLDGHPVL
jgi:hypothetical protein